MRIGKDLVAASATPLVLGILAAGPRHGYAILKQVEQLTDGAWEWTDGMLYPLLHRLERLGLVSSGWQTSPEGRRRKTYAITAAGRATLTDQRRQWDVVTRALRSVADSTARSAAAPHSPEPGWVG